MAETEAQLKARLLKLTNEMAALAKRGQEIQREIQKILAKMPIDDEPTASEPVRAKRSHPKLRGKSAKPR